MNYDENDKINFFINFYIENKKVKICKYCNLITHENLNPEINICDHMFESYTNKNNKYLIDTNFSTWIINNNVYIESCLNNLNKILNIE